MVRWLQKNVYEIFIFCMNFILTFASLDSSLYLLKKMLNKMQFFFKRKVPWKSGILSGIREC